MALHCTHRGRSTVRPRAIPPIEYAHQNFLKCPTRPRGFSWIWRSFKPYLSTDSVVEECIPLFILDGYDIVLYVCSQDVKHKIWIGKQSGEIEAINGLIRRKSANAAQPIKKSSNGNEHESNQGVYMPGSDIVSLIRIISSQAYALLDTTSKILQVSEIRVITVTQPSRMAAN